MARALRLDPTYLSQLENGRRDVDDWYVEKAEGLLREFEKSKEVKTELREGAPVSGRDEVRARCHLHLNKVLDECRDDQELSWTYVELKKRFPLRGSLSSISLSEAEASVAGAERAIEMEGRGSYASPQGCLRADSLPIQPWLGIASQNCK